MDVMTFPKVNLVLFTWLDNGMIPAIIPAFQYVTTKMQISLLICES